MMASRPDDRVPPPDDLVAAVAAAATDNARLWFPGLDGHVHTRVLAAQQRPRCFLYPVQLDDGHERRHAVVKVRHSQPGLRRLDRFQQRPQLNPERTMSDRDTAGREYEGLQLISAALEGSPGERFGVLRPLGWLPEHSAIVMDRVSEPTLRHALLQGSRLRMRRGQGVAEEAAFVNAGAWLRVYHDHVPNGNGAELLPARNATRDEVSALYQGYCDFLEQRLGSAAFLTALAAVGGGLVAAAVPAELPVRTGHGDFVANNMFLGPAGRITVFDPLPRWRVPLYQDLATFVVAIGIHPLQAATQGLAFGRGLLADREDALLHGYFGSDPVPLPAVKAYQLLVLLDRWTALVSKQITWGRVRPYLHAARVRVAVHHYQREARRLLAELRALDSRPSG